MRRHVGYGATRIGVLFFVGLLACGTADNRAISVRQPGTTRSPAAESGRSDDGPVVSGAPLPAPGGAERDRTLAYWLDRTEDLDEVLLSPADVAALDQSLAEQRGGDDGAPGAPDVRPTSRPVTRRAVLEAAFRFRDAPCRFGGLGEGRDRSRFVLDLLAGFGIRLPRLRDGQSRAGSFWIDVAEADEHARRQVIDAAARRGLVLLQLPKQLMLYLGRNDDGQQMAIHALGDHARACEASGDSADIARRVDRVVVSDLEHGGGGERGAFIERIERVSVLGNPPGPALSGIARLRPPAPATIPGRDDCRADGDVALFVSPDTPNDEQPLTIVATSAKNPGPVDLVLVDPAGNRHHPPVSRTSGPPYGLIASVDHPAPGQWQVVLGDGDQTKACGYSDVRHGPPKARRVARSAPVWEVHNAWTSAEERLYSVWLERLFDSSPSDDTRTWDGVTTLLRDPERNILFGHLQPGDDDRLELKADCADLSYVLRAYFSWKLRLPFAFRSCDRADDGKPPSCRSRAGDNLMHGFAGDEVDVFEAFSNSYVRPAVNSSSARTRPRDEESDYYPVPLSREALAPGTLFVDPYGHVLMIVDWVPQALDRYGILVAADAQPDGTVGLRRFWRGSFLFDADTEAGGTGFKQYRPRIVRDGAIVNLTNQQLAGTRQFTPFSVEQYAGGVEAFYRKLESVINPRPLDPFARQRALVDAFEEQVARRVVSVDNGEDYLRKHGFELIDMPYGASIFLTSGDWEKFSTPSRDLRLLIALDTVARFPDRVAASPERFGIASDGVGEVVARLREALARELEARKITYRGSDGTARSRSLAEIVERQEALEMAYNPNDCVEIRWLALPDSDEMASCKRRAPESQQRRMQAYRGWFATRRRPAN